MFKLSDLPLDMPIAIQCHDAPDADALASGYALHCFLSSLGHSPLFFFGGRSDIVKPNLRIMRDTLGIPIVYAPEMQKWDGLLITVDCQYGSNNVHKVTAEKLAVIDHHMPGTALPELNNVQPQLGSCATLVWSMLNEAGFSLKADKRKLAIALYYGLYTDTNGFSEIRHPVDLDMRDALTFHDPQVMIQEEPILKTLFTSNLSLEDIDIAFSALHAIKINQEKKFALVEAAPCDQNLLGFISDLAVQVDKIDIVIAWTPQGDGWKFSIRTSGRLARAIDIISWIVADGYGNGGGHKDKGGGWISRPAVMKDYNSVMSFFLERLSEYSDVFQIIDKKTPKELTCSGMRAFRKKNIVIGYVPSTEIFAAGTRICLRMLEGDAVTTADDDCILMIGTQSEVYFMHREKFEAQYTPEKQPPGSYKPAMMSSYAPTASALGSPENIALLEHARSCSSKAASATVSAKQLDRPAKVFPAWDEYNYLLAEPGDWLIMQNNDPDDLYVIKGKVFPLLYEAADK